MILQKVILMNRYNLNVMLLLSGFYVIVGLSIIMVLRHVLSGDSIILKQSVSMPQLIQKQSVKK